MSACSSSEPTHRDPIDRARRPRRPWGGWLRPAGAATAVWMLFGTAALAAEPGGPESSCDRTCLAGYADRLTASMTAHDPGSLPLASAYRATENGVPAGLPMMTIWQTATGLGGRFYVIDPVSSQIFLIADVREGHHDALLFGRLKIVRQRISELELYVDRSRSDGGFQFSAIQLARPAPQWTAKVEPSRLPTRAQLLAYGRSTFDTSLPSPPAASGCLLMENGKIVQENPDFAQFVSGASHPPPLDAEGFVNIPCGVFPGRPTDPLARTDIVDEAQGVVVSFATISGVVEPYIVTDPTLSAFVPDTLLTPYLSLLNAQRKSGKHDLPAVRPMPASIAVAEMHRYYDGKLQGLYMLQKLSPLGARSPWTAQ